MKTGSLFTTLMNIEFKTEKLRLKVKLKNEVTDTKLCITDFTEKYRLNPSFSVLASMFIRVMKRAFVCPTVIITQKVYDTFSSEYPFPLKTLCLHKNHNWYIGSSFNATMCLPS